MEWYLKVLKQYADFNGRARRKEYWMFVLCNVAIVTILYVFIGIGVAMDSKAITGIFYGLVSLYSLAVLVPSLAVTVRRLHDIGKEWIYILVALIPIVGGIWLLVLMATEGTHGANQFGPDPKETTGISNTL